MKDPIIYAGYSRLNGALKFRTATSEARVNQLERTDSDVHMLLIKPVATKSQAAKELIAVGHMSKVPEIQALYVAKAQDDNPFKAKKTTVVVRVPTRFSAELTGADTQVDGPMTAREAKKIRDAFNAQVRAAYEAN